MPRCHPAPRCRRRPTLRDADADFQVKRIPSFPPDSNIDNATPMSTMRAMSNWTRPELRVLAGLYLQNEQSFVVRRSVQLFLAGEITSREAIARIRRHPGVRDEDPYPND